MLTLRDWEKASPPLPTAAPSSENLPHDTEVVEHSSELLKELCEGDAERTSDFVQRSGSNFLTPSLHLRQVFSR